jgi:hypothetical protein
LASFPNRGLPVKAEWREFCRKLYPRKGYPMPKSAQRTIQSKLEQLIDQMNVG